MKKQIIDNMELNKLQLSWNEYVRREKVYKKRLELLKVLWKMIFILAGACLILWFVISGVTA